jgi:hypothetical protein
VRRYWIVPVALIVSMEYPVVIFPAFGGLSNDKRCTDSLGCDGKTAVRSIVDDGFVYSIARFNCPYQVLRTGWRVAKVQDECLSALCMSRVVKG